MGRFEGRPHTFGSIKCEVLTTPGHTPGSLSIYFPELNSIMTGDLLFYHSVGRTDFPGSSQEALRKSLHKKIFILRRKPQCIRATAPTPT